jgi:hypothetical protein
MSEAQARNGLDTVPKRTLVRFRMPGGDVFAGTWEPFWCGSDCPCDVGGEGFAPCNEESVCWCAYRNGSGPGEEVDPIGWLPIAPVAPTPTA